MGDEPPRTAFDDPDTLRAWQRARRRATAATTFWVLSVPGFFVLETIGWESLVGGSLPAYVMVVPILVSVIGITVSDSRRVQLKNMRGILATYPWQDRSPLKRIAPADLSRLKIPNPDDLDKSVSVVVRRYGLLSKRRRDAVANASTSGFKYAGDPRFATVIALQGAGELGTARPAHALSAGKGDRPDGVSEAAWQRARAAGISGESPFTAEQLKELQNPGKRGSGA
ncbi:hypothetical protein [Streptomyces pseudovenezuelae]|uniref:Uncharacterized protein n=1 Tax=Streptomyces pseudovenezuelae TaxID=67350 RepID=A0ABT6LNA6_9ACTN|nr:hypothetical protein [Streptomyces pseudovenezuelae]MDH6217752.1 hypothetical protein [Streptomyces pseudovenezuelae]